MPSYIPKELKAGTQIDSCIALFITVKMWKLKSNEILTHATWMNLANIMLSEISQTQKDKHCMIKFVCGI